MADNLSFSWELRGKLEQQIKDAVISAEKLAELVKELNVDVKKLDDSKINLNISKNVKDAENALYRLMDAKEKVDKALSRNSYMKADDFLGMDDSKLRGASARIDEIVEKIMSIGAEAKVSGNYVKNLLASLSSDLTIKDAKNASSTVDKGLDKQIKERIRIQKELSKDIAAAEKDAEKEAANNLKNQERIKDALARIATARANLSAASQQGNQQEIAHAQLLLSLLDRLTQKLSGLRNQFLGEKGALDGVLGSGYKGLMRNVNVAIRDMLNNRGMSDTEWEAAKALAAQEERRREITNVVEEQAAIQKKAAAQEAADVARVNELLEMRQHRLEMEHKKTAEINAQNERRLTIEGDSAAWHTRNKEMADAAAREKELLRLRDAIINRYEREAAAQERANATQQAQYQSRQRATQATRQQAEELVRLRMELLRTQAAELQSLMKNGKGVFSAQQYKEVQDALRSVRQELLMLEQVAQRMGSYSSRELFGFGRGTQNWSPLISNGNQILGALKEMTQEERAFIDSISKANDAFGTQSRLLSDLRMMAQQYVSIMGAKSFIDRIIETGGQLENQRRSIAAILGEAAYANDLFEKIQTLALRSPFGVVDLDQYTKQLSAYGFEYNELFEWTKRLADISAGTGTDFSRLVLALGHVRSEMALTGYTLRQFAMGNIPMLQKLSENLGVTTQEIRKMVREKKISYEDVAQVLKDLTDEGGMFYNMQEVISESVKSRFKNLKDAMDIMYGQIAEGSVGDTLKEVAKILTELTKKWQVLMPVILSAVSITTALHLRTLIYNASLKQNVFSLLQQANSLKNLSAQQIRQMYLNKELTQEQILMAVATRKLTADQAALAAEMFNVTRAQLQQIGSMKSGMMGMASRFLTPANLGMAAAFVGIEATIAAYSAYNSWIDGIESRVNQMIETSKAGLDELSKYYNTIGEKPTEEQDLKAQSEEMITILKNSGLWTDEMEKQIGLTANLSSQYDALVEKIREGKEELENTSNDGGVLSRIIQSSSTNPDSFKGDPLGFLKGAYDFLFNDSIEQNAAQLEESLKNFKFFYDSISEYHSELTETLKNAPISESFKESVKDLPIEDQLRLLKKSDDDWELFKSYLHELNPEIDKVIDKLGKRLDDVTGKTNEILTDDVRKMKERWMSELELEASEFDEWAKKHPKQVKDMVDALVQYLSEKAPIVSGLMRNMFLSPGTPIPLIGTPVKTELQLQKEEAERNRILTNNANKKIGDIALTQLPQLQKLDKTIDSVWLSNYLDVNKSASDIAKEVASDKDRLEKELQNAKNMGRSTKEIEEELHRVQTLKNFYHFPDKSKGNKGDSELKGWREELKELENFYKMYKRNLEYMSKDDAIQNALDSGVFINKDKMPKNIDEYLKILLGFRDKIKSELQKKSTPERESFLTDLLSKIDEKELEVNVKKPVDAIIKQLDKDLKEQSKRWDVYKQIYNVSGDDIYAKYVAFGTDAIITAENEADELKSKIESLLVGTKAEGKSVDELLKLDDEDLKELDIYAKNANGIYQTLEKYRDASESLRNEEAKSLEDALKKLSDISDQIAVAENKLADARRKYGENSVQALAIEKELADLRAKQLEESELYLRFYSGVMGMTIEEAESAGAAIKENLVKQLADGTINADRYLKSVKNVDAQLSKIRSKKGLFSAFATGGIKAVLEVKRENGDANAANAAIRVQKAEERLRKARENLGKLTEKSTEEEREKAQQEELSARVSLSQAKIDEAKARKAQELLGLDEAALSEMTMIVAIADTFVGAIEGVAQAMKQVSEMFEALGDEGRAASWSDTADYINAIASPFRSSVNASKSALNGDVGGAISNTVGIVTSPITAFAQLHDKKRERKIVKSQKEVKKLANEYDNLKDAIERALGGVYTSGGYTEMLDNLKKQRDEIQHQMDVERSKKNSDSDRLEDYKQQLHELDVQIENFAMDMANTLYSIDLKSWASELGDALFEAWKKGEDGAEAFKKKANQLISDVAKNIVSVSILETALEPVKKTIANMMNETDGKLNPVNFAAKVANALNTSLDMVDKTYNKTMDAVDSELQKRGYGSMKDNDDSSSSSNSLNSMTEQTADLIASYINAIRADVSVNRMTLQQILAKMLASNAVGVEPSRPARVRSVSDAQEYVASSGLSDELTGIARAQLTQLQQIAGNTSRNAASAEQIYNLLHRLAPDGTRLQVK